MKTEEAELRTARELRDSRRMIRELREQRDALLEVAKNHHGWDDPLHTRAFPKCKDCATIAKAEGR